MYTEISNRMSSLGPVNLKYDELIQKEQSIPYRYSTIFTLNKGFSYPSGFSYSHPTGELYQNQYYMLHKLGDFKYNYITKGIEYVYNYETSSNPIAESVFPLPSSFKSLNYDYIIQSGQDWYTYFKENFRVNLFKDRISKKIYHVKYDPELGTFIFIESFEDTFKNYKIYEQFYVYSTISGLSKEVVVENGQFVLYDSDKVRHNTELYVHDDQLKFYEIKLSDSKTSPELIAINLESEKNMYLRKYAEYDSSISKSAKTYSVYSYQDNRLIQSNKLYLGYENGRIVENFYIIDENVVLYDFKIDDTIQYYTHVNNEDIALNIYDSKFNLIKSIPVDQINSISIDFDKYWLEINYINVDFASMKYIEPTDNVKDRIDINHSKLYIIFTIYNRSGLIDLYEGLRGISFKIKYNVTSTNDNNIQGFLEYIDPVNIANIFTIKRQYVFPLDSYHTMLKQNWCNDCGNERYGIVGYKIKQGNIFKYVLFVNDSAPVEFKEKYSEVVAHNWNFESISIVLSNPEYFDARPFDLDMLNSLKNKNLSYVEFLAFNLPIKYDNNLRSYKITDISNNFRNIGLTVLGSSGNFTLSKTGLYTYDGDVYLLRTAEYTDFKDGYVTDSFLRGIDTVDYCSGSINTKNIIKLKSGEIYEIPFDADQVNSYSGICYSGSSHYYVTTNYIFDKSTLSVYKRGTIFPIQESFRINDYQLNLSKKVQFADTLINNYAYLDKVQVVFKYGIITDTDKYTITNQG